MPRLRFPTPEQFKRYVPYPFLATWIACGIVVFVALLAERGPARGQDGAVPLVPCAVVAVVTGYLAAGVVVGLSVARPRLGVATDRQPSARRRTGDRVYSGALALRDLAEGRLRLLYLGFLLAAAAALRVDCGLAEWCVAGNVPDSCTSHWTFASVFGHGMMAFLVLVAIYQLDPSRRRMLWWVLACVALSGLAANGRRCCWRGRGPGPLISRATCGQRLAGGCRWATCRRVFLPATPPRPQACAGADGALSERPPAVCPAGRLGGLPAACVRAHYLSDVLAARRWAVCGRVLPETDALVFRTGGNTRLVLCHSQKL